MENPQIPPPSRLLWRARAQRLRVAAVVVFALGSIALGALVVHIARQPPSSLDVTDALASRTPQRPWQLRRGKHWQVASAPSESQEATDAAEGTRGACAPGMVEVEGRMKMDPPQSGSAGSERTVEELQKTTCTRWINREYPERCAQFDRAAWLELSKELSERPMHFCIDRYEYPDQKGAYPWIGVSWYEAVEICADEGKRLCDELEWTFACEGEEATPYPYGYARDPEACVIDKTWRPYNEKAMRPRDGEAAMLEMDKLWQGVPSGSKPRCRSPFGVYDLTGNVDEWTRSAREGERPSILKGGYWGPVRTRCRPSTRSHDENHVFYQEGFRCCTDPGVTPIKKTGSDDPSLAPIPRALP